MNCTEARRRLLGPEGRLEEAAARHVASCRPCRMEAEALVEVDRRLQMLGDYQLLSAPTILPQLDRQLQHLQAARGRARKPRPGVYLAWAAIAAFLVAIALWLIQFRR